jgi:REP element-mobilizing transposase RayT
MPRRLVPFHPGEYFHLYNRGNNRQAIFFQPENYIYFLKNIKRYLLPVTEVLVYCLMPTHYHILARIREMTKTSSSKTSEFFKNSEVSVSSEVSMAMMRLSVSYTKAINKRFERVGALFQGQFQARPVTDENHLLQLCRYIHGNPVKDGLVFQPGDWPYSNYLEWMGERPGTLVNRDFIASYFASPGEYREFVLDYLKTRDLPDEVQTYLNELE